MKRKAKIGIGILLAMMCTFCSCQSAPEKESIISKNDGSFDANAVQSAEGDTPKSILLQESFTSTDKSVTFTFDAKLEVPTMALPVVEVVPHILSEEDIRRGAYAIFGDVTYYEALPLLGEPTEIYSKSQIQDFLSRWSVYSSQEALDAVFGPESYNQADVVKKFIESYTAFLEDAPDEVNIIPCKWKLIPDYMYFYTGADLETVDSPNPNYNIEADLIFERMPYRFQASVRNEEDFKLNTLYGRTDRITPAGFDSDLYWVELQNTGVATEEVMEIAAKKVSRWLEDMNLGQWMIDCCTPKHWYFSGNQGTEQWNFTVTAVPVFAGTPAIRRNQITNLRSEEAYASNYYLTDASFTFNAEGKLLEFCINSPVDVKNVVNEHTKTLSIEQLLERAKEHLSLSDIHEYTATAGAEKNDLDCKVKVNKIEYGLTRVKAPHTDESYYYVPALIIYGSSETVDNRSGEVWELVEEYPLLILNAVDGSVIPNSNASPI